MASMGFWRRLGEGFWRRSLPSEPPPLAPGEGRGTSRDGKKEGLWAERSTEGVTTWLFYEGGRKHGPFRDFYATGEKRTEGIYVDGLLDGPWETFHKDGAIAGIATFSRGKLEGIHRMFLPSGAVKLESRYLHDLRDGPWRLLRDDGTLHEEGAHDLGLRVGPWKIHDERGGVREEGAYEAGERSGPFVFRDGGATVEATFRQGVLHGPFRVLSDGELLCEGGFRAGMLERGATFAEGAGDKLAAARLPEPTVRRWVDIESAIAALAPETELPKRFVDMNDETEDPSEADTRARIASHEAWLSLFAEATKLGALERRFVAKRLEAKLADTQGALLPEAGYPAWNHLVAAREPHPLARFVTTICFDHAHFDEEASARFRERFAKELRRLSLFECTFEPSLAAFLSGTPFEALEVLEIADYDRKGRGLGALVEATWAARLVRLAFDGTEAEYDDEKLAKVFSSERLGALRSLSLGVATPGVTTEAALRSGPVARSLEELHFVQSTLSDPIVEAITSCLPALRRCKLERCTVSANARARLEAWGATEGRRLVVIEPGS